jgi:hypothetical protein
MGYASRNSKLKLIERRSIVRELDLTPYKIKVTGRSRTGEVETKETDYDVKASIALILFHPDLKVSARESIKRDELCNKIETAGDSILLEEADWQKIKEAVEIVTVGRNDVKFILRVLEAPEIKVKKDSEETGGGSV